MKNIFHIALFAGLTALSCGNRKPAESTIEESYIKVSPNFDADSAYNFVDKQTAFGVRVPNSAGHKACGNYLLAELKRFGAETTEQKTSLKAFDGVVLEARNIIGSFSPEKADRVLLMAHWDTRPFADQDPDPAKCQTPILGANDAGSGVGVLLEIARLIRQQQPTVGVDIIFFDAEDYGAPAFAEYEGNDNTWCLGSQYWAKNPHVKAYTARFGILLDMVGAPNAVFAKEYFSQRYARGIVEKVWQTARQLGYGLYFKDKTGGAVTDDHLPVNTERRIPSIDVIQYDEDTGSGFGWYWHTTNDDMSNISKETLKAVGQTVLEVIYKEK
ncbi:MAG: M28 family peptidase [Prevotella sp.]|jgi:Zn-dependent M28 family amino/carboxypeptidase|nr:M28 family peptidase [Prevotella sp.]